MKFISDKNLLEENFLIAEKFTGKNINLPILENVLLETKGDILNLNATNLEYAINLEIKGKGEKDGKVSVSAKILSQLIHSIKEKEIKLEEKEGNLLIKSNSVNVKINGGPVNDFPIIPKIKKSFSSVLDGYSLKTGLEKVLPAVSNSEFKPELGGVFFNSSKKTTKLAATDTFRLAEFTIKTNNSNLVDDFKFILPAKLSSELSRILKNEEEVNVSFGENQVLLEFSNSKIISRVIDGSFPDYEGIIPKSFNSEVVINRDKLFQNIRSSSIFASRLQDVSLNFGHKQLEISTSNPEVGEYKVFVPVEMFSGKELKISFNYRYLLDALGVIEGKEVFIGLSSENAPVLIRDNSDISYLYILMPLRFT